MFKSLNKVNTICVGILIATLFVQCSEDLNTEFSIDESSEDLSLRARDHYVVILREGLDLASLEEVRGVGNGLLKQIRADQDPEFTYAHSVKGFTAYLSPGQRKQLLKLDEVVSVDLDEVLTLGPPPGKGWNKTDGGEEEEVAAAQETPWGIVRVNGGITNQGRAFVLDSGIDLDHPDLNVDRSLEFTAFTRGKDAGTNDRNGHGTHVAGTIAAIDNDLGVIGVAAGAAVIPVKVLGSSGSGSWSGILAGVDHVAKHGRPGDVANLSLGGGVYEALDRAIANAAASTGVKFIIAAGNEYQDASNSSPARTEGVNVYTISAMDINDRFASFSNYGSPVDYASPGVNILSTWNDGAYHTISGTSMAAPHVAGLMLLGSETSDGVVRNDPDGTNDPILVK